MSAAIFARTGADAHLSSPDALYKRMQTTPLDNCPYLCKAGKHIAGPLELSVEQGTQIALALGSTDETLRQEHACRVLGGQTSEAAACPALMRAVDAAMTRHDRMRLHAEIAAALGDVHS